MKIELRYRFDRTSEEQVWSLNDLLRISAPGLEHLSLSFRGLRDFESFERPYYAANRLTRNRSMFAPGWTAGSRQYPHHLPGLYGWRNLISFSLQGMKCTRDEFQKISSPISKTLRYLKLSDIELVPVQHKRNADTQTEVTPCLVKLIHWLHDGWNLESVKLRDGFYDGGKKMWWANVDPDPSGILEDYADHEVDASLLPFRFSTLAELEAYISYGGDCPVDHLAVVDGESDNYGEQPPCYYYLNNFRGTDGTFFVHYYTRADRDIEIRALSSDPSSPTSSIQDAADSSPIPPIEDLEELF